MPEKTKYGPKLFILISRTSLEILTLTESFFSSMLSYLRTAPMKNNRKFLHPLKHKIMMNLSSKTLIQELQIVPFHIIQFINFFLFGSTAQVTLLESDLIILILLTGANK